MIQIIGTRRSGRTVKLIRLCKKLNDAAGHNQTIILVSDLRRAHAIYDEALKIGCGDIPFPAIPEDILGHPTTFYKRVLIDDLDSLMQRLLGLWELAGYTIQGPNRTEYPHGWISESEV